ncbi:MAG TPA: (Na+)-NQR maturation NqrM [Gammaproteobacteria bacterium]|nr:(Na+)-NQR maturation NqrM [Chiayiivirga sp.]HRP34704.1 (Na+)-NQR maturation NqrM [Gammaproteobacteria bacterium]
MATFLLAFTLFATAIGAMSIGVMLGRRRIEGSCGGLNQVAGIESDCGGACRRPCARRRSAS